jgi:hypothetical protein
MGTVSGSFRRLTAGERVPNLGGTTHTAIRYIVAKLEVTTCGRTMIASPCVTSQR